MGITDTVPSGASSRDPVRIWPFNGLDVTFRDCLDGGGRALARPFIDFIRQHFPGRTFPRAFEWCAGPGFIGFALLREGLCAQLCLADVNPDAVACVRDTITNNDLGDRTSTYVSQNFDRIPASEMFDLVVANPPNYCGLNPKHPQYDEYKHDLRPNDPGWRIHREFYADVGSHLNPGGLLLISEVEPTLTQVGLKGAEPWDLRGRPPIQDFKEMIADGGLSYTRTVPLVVEEGVLSFVVVSQKAVGARVLNPLPASKSPDE